MSGWILHDAPEQLRQAVPKKRQSTIFKASAAALRRLNQFCSLGRRLFRFHTVIEGCPPIERNLLQLEAQYGQLALRPAEPILVMTTSEAVHWKGHHRLFTQCGLLLIYQQ